MDDIEIPSDVVETERHEKGKGDEGFVPGFAVPAGVLVPSSVRQHLMMVSTARNAVRSPQVRKGRVALWAYQYFLPCRLSIVLPQLRACSIRF